TSDCRKSGGTYTSGYCKNDPADVKCCTYGECRIPVSDPLPGDPNESIAGVCFPTAYCANAPGISYPGHCPGPSDIQCCRE
ncbi:hypothetical protein BGX26_000573, partial [Mortierella sp. AD094]